MTQDEKNILREKVLQILMNHAKSTAYFYKERWKPNDSNLEEAYSLFRAPEGFEPYTLDEIIRRQKVFWRCKDDWLVGCKHNFSVFVRHIHRWLPAQKKTPLILPLKSKGEKVWQCPECGNELLTPGEICQKCFPTCIDCGFQHYPNETCEAFKQRDEAIKKLFNRKPSRTGEVTTIMGEKVFLKPSQKK